MAEPERQIEVQLGHLCNNRCVFCVSGQLSEQKRAPQLPVDPIAEQIRASIESQPLLAERAVTASIGVATLREDDDWSELMKRSDRNLYQAKTNGRNCVYA